MIHVCRADDSAKREHYLSLSLYTPPLSCFGCAHEEGLRHSRIRGPVRTAEVVTLFSLPIAVSLDEHGARLQDGGKRLSPSHAVTLALLEASGNTNGSRALVDRVWQPQSLLAQHRDLRG